MWDEAYQSRRLTRQVRAPYWMLDVLMNEQSRKKPLLDRLKDRLRDLVEDLVESLGEIFEPEPEPVRIPVRGRR